MTASPTRRPLEGMRVLDLGTFLAGPFCATQLAEFGAEVVKVELPRVGDALRKFGSPTESGDSMVWLSESRNKKCITLDLRKPEGADLFKRLAAKADVVVENFQKGTLEKWGLGWDVLHALYPRLVMVRITGYGQTGPYAGRPGFARIGQAFGGLSFLAGYPDRPPVTPGSSTIADYLSGIYGALGALIALRGRDATGEGQYVDIGLYESVFRILDEIVPSYQRNGYVRQRMGPGTVNVCPHSHYPTKDDRWVAIACTSDKIFARLAEVMGHPELAGDGKWGTIAARDKDRDNVDAFVSAWTRTLEHDEVLRVCSAGEVPCGPVYSIEDIFKDPHFAARENIATIDDPRVGTIAVPNVVPKLSAMPGAIEWLGAPLGAHNEAVYGEWLGLDAATMKELADKAVI